MVLWGMMARCQSVTSQGSCKCKPLVLSCSSKIFFMSELCLDMLMLSQGAYGGSSGSRLACNCFDPFYTLYPTNKMNTAIKLF